MRCYVRTVLLYLLRCKNCLPTRDWGLAGSMRPNWLHVKSRAMSHRPEYPALSLDRATLGAVQMCQRSHRGQLFYPCRCSEEAFHRNFASTSSYEREMLRVEFY
jgi:hypothetical protein